MTYVGNKIFSDVRVNCKLHNESNVYIFTRNFGRLCKVGDIHCRDWGPYKKYFTRSCCVMHWGSGTEHLIPRGQKLRPIFVL